jgi:transposase InsO family protein
MCQVLGASTGGSYGWRRRPPSRRQPRREALVADVKAVHAEVKARCGSPRIHAELVARGTPWSVNTVAALMRQHGIAAQTKRKFRCTTDSNHDRPVAEDVVARGFEPEGPIGSGRPTSRTSRPVRDGCTWRRWRDLHSRRIVGRSMSERIDGRLVVDALEMAIAQRHPREGLVAHSDRGSRYASEDYQRLLARHGIACGMSGRGDCWGNAPMESFLASLKKGLVHGADFATREEARAELFESIEVFHNRVRRDSALGDLSPEEYERAG